MKIVMLTDWFAEGMGYSENLFPKALAKLGADVHVVTSDLQPDFPNYKETYEPFLGPRQQPTGRRRLDGYTLHRLPHGSQWHGIYIRGLHRTLSRLRPDVVQCFTLASVTTLQAVACEIALRFKLFLEEHIHWSVFEQPTTWKRKAFFAAYRTLVGNLLSRRSELCYPIAPDVERITVEYLGYNASKVRLCPLGVDTDLFVPATTAAQRSERADLRRSLGFGDGDIVAVYTGRFTDGKNPLCLAKAIDEVHREDPRFKGLFVGSGTADYLKSIQACSGCVIHPFVEASKLPGFYRASDIGVWPKQESTSQLDAAACGLPLVLGNKIEVKERIEGNGFLFEEDDPHDLARQLRALADPQLRRRLGDAGAVKVREKYSWDRIAKDRLNDYEAALRN
jgi:glycosyltransferase involved in cell wall biosynthesis